MEKLRRELYLFMLELAKLRDEQAIKSEFEAGVGRICGGVQVHFVPGDGKPGDTGIRVATASSSFGVLDIGCARSEISSDVLSLLDDAADMLALILEGRAAAGRVAKSESSPESDAAVRLLRRRFEAIPVGIVVHAADGAIIYANTAACEILRLNHESLLPTTPQGPEWYSVGENGTVFRPEDYPGARMARAGKPVREAIMGVRSPGQSALRWFSINAEPQSDDLTGMLKEVIITLVDVSTLKQVEEALRLSEDKFATAFNSSPDSININRLSDGLYLDVNKAFTDWTGYSRDELIGRSSLDLSIWAHVEDRDTLIRGLREHGECLGLEAEFRKKSGEVGVGLMSARITNVDGEPCIISVTRDITEQRRAEDIRRQYESQMEAQKRQFYRDTISSVTAGKLLICDDADIEPYISSAAVEFDVRRTEDVHAARHRVETYLRENGLVGERLADFILAIGECITNAVKHGIHGCVYAGRSNDSVWAAIKDEGKGIESLILPQAVLRQGFSTKPSLGLGYSIMLDASDSLMLKTGDTGTTVVLIKRIVEREMITDLDGIPDTWD